MGVVGGQGGGDVPGAQLVQRGPFPGLDLAVVVLQPDRVEPAGQAGERAAGVELGELVVVPDQHQAPVGRLHLRQIVEEVGS